MSFNIETRIIKGYGVNEYHYATLDGMQNRPRNWSRDLKWEPVDSFNHLIILDPDCYKGVLERRLPNVTDKDPIRKLIVEANRSVREKVRSVKSDEELERDLNNFAENHELAHVWAEENLAASSILGDSDKLAEYLYEDEKVYRSLKSRQILLAGYLEALADSMAASKSDNFAFSIHLLEILRSFIVEDPEDKKSGINPENFLKYLLLEVKERDGTYFHPHGLSAMILLTGCIGFEEEMWGGKLIYLEKILPKFEEGVNMLVQNPEKFTKIITERNFIDRLISRIRVHAIEQLKEFYEIVIKEDINITPNSLFLVAHYGLNYEFK